MKTQLTALYLDAIDGLIAKYPCQEANRLSYLTFASKAQVGHLTRRIRTKGDLTDFAKGTTVLYAKDEYEEGLYSIWGVRNPNDSLRTLVEADAIAELKN